MFVRDNEEILIEEEVITETQVAIVKKHHCFFAKINLIGPNTTTINVPITLTAAYFDWQNNPLIEENREIKIKIIGPGLPSEITLMPINGQADFDFISPVDGIFKIQALAYFGCNVGEMEVTVNA